MGNAASVENASFDKDKFAQSKAIMDSQVDDHEKFEKLRKIWAEGGGCPHGEHHEAPKDDHHKPADAAHHEAPKDDHHHAPAAADAAHHEAPKDDHHKPADAAHHEAPKDGHHEAHHDEHHKAEGHKEEGAHH